MKFKVSCAQISPVLGDIDKNIKLHLKHIDNRTYDMTSKVFDGKTIDKTNR